MSDLLDEGQIDFVKSADALTRQRGYLRTAADRFGIPELAHALKVDDSTLRNQLDYRPRKDKPNSFWRPTADAVFALWPFDRRYRSEMLSVCDEKIEDDEPLDPEVIVRDLYARGVADEYGKAFRAYISEQMRRMRKVKR